MFSSNFNSKDPNSIENKIIVGSTYINRNVRSDTNVSVIKNVDAKHGF